MSISSFFLNDVTNYIVKAENCRGNFNTLFQMIKVKTKDLLIIKEETIINNCKIKVEWR